MKKIQSILIYWFFINFINAQSSQIDVEENTKNFTQEQKQALEKYLNEGSRSKETFNAPDFSNENTDTLLDRALSANMGKGLDYPFIIEELTRRSDQLQDIINIRVSIPIPENQLGFYIREIKGLPELAKLVSIEFQVETARKSLLREGIPKDIGSYLLSYDYLLDILQKSKKDESSILDKLIETGRIEKNSNFEKKWRPLLSKNIPSNQNKKNNDDTTGFKFDTPKSKPEPSKNDVTKVKNNSFSSKKLANSHDKGYIKQLEAKSPKPANINKESNNIPLFLASGLALIVITLVYYIKRKN